ncbi:hypothetical protein DSO57_1039470 [Entomophthora muscae]|uniref:Uncharacterized protein n=1 Tax=Entomophthora muscae TaxID=34485 RepID=A0ACC2TKC3_9FUNG|nr:hypothetical protein DSO57_1039470 [Entomophthora muscae]
MALSSGRSLRPSSFARIPVGAQISGTFSQSMLESGPLAMLEVHPLQSLPAETRPLKACINATLAQGFIPLYQLPGGRDGDPEAALWTQAGPIWCTIMDFGEIDGPDMPAAMMSQAFARLLIATDYKNDANIPLNAKEEHITGAPRTLEWLAKQQQGVEPQ